MAGLIAARSGSFCMAVLWAVKFTNFSSLELAVYKDVLSLTHWKGRPITSVSGEVISILWCFVCFAWSQSLVSVSSALQWNCGSGWGLFPPFTHHAASRRWPSKPPATYRVWFSCRCDCTLLRKYHVRNLTRFLLHSRQLMKVSCHFPLGILVFPVSSRGD